MPDPEHDQRQSWVNHLEELRRCLIWSLAVLAGAAVVMWPWSAALLDLLARPVGQLVFLGPAEAFRVRVKLAALTGGVLASPWMAFQVWRFVAVGLTARERRMCRASIIPVVVLGGLGVTFGYVLVVPWGVTFLTAFGTDAVVPMLSLDRYMAFVTGVLVAFGLAFEMPVVIVLGNRLGWLDVQRLSAYRRHVLVGFALFAAILTPPDVVTQVALAAPLYVLYELSIQFCRWTSKSRGSGGD